MTRITQIHRTPNICVNLRDLREEEFNALRSSEFELAVSSVFETNNKYRLSSFEHLA
jgi:hypothetical protein